jgi:predicted DNA-binding transcriptional regulator
MLQQSLIRLGLKEKEVSVFLTLVGLGPQPASVIAKRAELNRGTAYAILDGLVARGLVSRIVKAGIQTFCSISPEEILEIIRMRKRELDTQESELQLILPQLKSMMSGYALQPKVRHYEGVEGVKAVMEETLNSSETILSYANIDAWQQTPLDEYIKTYCHRRSYELKIPLRCLAYDTQYAKDHFGHNHGLYELHFIPKSVRFDQSLINIFENKVIMVSLVPGMMYGIVIESEEIAQTQKAIFELAWMGCDPKCVSIRG